MDEENIKKENVRSETKVDIKDEPDALWEGEVRFKSEERSEEMIAPVQIFHKDDSKNGCRLFDWAPYGKQC